MRRKPDAPVYHATADEGSVIHSAEPAREMPDGRNSPFDRAKGDAKAAEPRFVQYGIPAVELLQWGREASIYAPRIAVKSEDKGPYT